MDSLAGGWGIVPAHSGNGYVICANENITYYKKHLQLLKIDPQGQIIDHRIFRKDSVRLWTGGGRGKGLIPFKDGYLLAGSYEAMQHKGLQKGMLWRFDENLDSVWTRTYDHYPNDSNQQFFKAIEYLPQEEALIMTGVTGVNDPFGWIVKTDTAGDLIWERTYGKSVDKDFLYDLTPAYDSGYFAVGLTFSFSDPNGGWVIRLDTAGNKEWQKVYENDSLLPYYLLNILPTPDSNFVASGVTLTSQGSKRSICYDKFRPDGTSLWKREYRDTGGVNNGYHFPTYHHKSIISSDGELITVGRRHGGFGNYEVRFTGYIQKVSLKDGNRFWDRNYYSTLGASNVDGENHLYDIVETPSGGFIAVGNVQPSSLDSGNQDIWIVGLDSIGCDTPNCTVSTPSFPEPPPESFELYPNPNDGDFRIRSTKSKGRFEATLSVRSVDGKRVLRERIEGRHPFEKRIRLPETASGVHLVEWKDERGSYVRRVVVK